jgi:F420-0:gamma-glutamyl ligase
MIPDLSNLGQRLLQAKLEEMEAPYKKNVAATHVCMVINDILEEHAKKNDMRCLSVPVETIIDAVCDHADLSMAKFTEMIPWLIIKLQAGGVNLVFSNMSESPQNMDATNLNPALAHFCW